MKDIGDLDTAIREKIYESMKGTAQQMMLLKLGDVIDLTMVWLCNPANRALLRNYLDGLDERDAGGSRASVARRYMSDMEREIEDLKRALKDQLMFNQSNDKAG